MDKKTMDVNTALKILDDALAGVVTTRQTHSLILNAFQVISTKVNQDTLNQDVANRVTEAIAKGV